MFLYLQLKISILYIMEASHTSQNGLRLFFSFPSPSNTRCQRRYRQHIYKVIILIILSLGRNSRGQVPFANLAGGGREVAESEGRANNNDGTPRSSMPPVSFCDIMTVFDRAVREALCYFKHFSKCKYTSQMDVKYTLIL